MSPSIYDCQSAVLMTVDLDTNPSSALSVGDVIKWHALRLIFVHKMGSQATHAICRRDRRMGNATHLISKPS
ncbi:hypothetical protein N7517_001302 [Penicillium concentricum]|uniref:Uncharacterized protein n=1 Tax=Penicillium concentricum TaxID=293559 RepID=A0A9W9SRZ5_9EURO|nr:uncharacterized protein N7517_001302 [Penicillium concentricum]KAJ5383391.1 hypothetical protein N7517_001302 [Penicillium concentricum]